MGGFGGPTFSGKSAPQAQKRAKLGKLLEGKKAKRKRLQKIAKSSGDPRERMWALTQLDEMSVARAYKNGKAVDMKTTVALPATKKAGRELVATLEQQAIHAPDPTTRLRAQDAIRELQGVRR